MPIDVSETPLEQTEAAVASMDAAEAADVAQPVRNQPPGVPGEPVRLRTCPGCLEQNGAARLFPEGMIDE